MRPPQFLSGSLRLFGGNNPRSRDCFGAPHNQFLMKSDGDFLEVECVFVIPGAPLGLPELGRALELADRKDWHLRREISG